MIIPSAFIGSILLAGGLYWCIVVLGRWRSDLAELCEVEDVSRKVVIVLIWLVTFVIAIFTASTAIGVIRGIARGVRDLI